MLTCFICIFFLGAKSNNGNELNQFNMNRQMVRLKRQTNSNCGIANVAVNKIVGGKKVFPEKPLSVDVLPDNVDRSVRSFVVSRLKLYRLPTVSLRQVLALLSTQPVSIVDVLIGKAMKQPEGSVVCTKRTLKGFLNIKLDDRYRYL